MEYKNKQQKELGIWLIIQLQGFQKIHDRIIEKQLQKKKKKKNQKKMYI